MDMKSLAHTKWNCIYHIVFIPKYRRKVMYGAVRTPHEGYPTPAGMKGKKRVSPNRNVHRVKALIRETRMGKPNEIIPQIKNAIHVKIAETNERS